VANSDTVILLFENGLIASNYTVLGSEGRFTFKWLKRRKYQFVVVSRKGLIFKLKEFSVDLRRDMLSSMRHRVRESFPTDTYRAAMSTKCFFDTGKDELDSAAKDKLTELFFNLPKEQYRIVIFGHADETGGEQNNIRLGKGRAAHAFAALTDGGANGRNALMASFGSERPDRPGSSAGELAANRRAEICVLTRDRNP